MNLHLVQGLIYLRSVNSPGLMLEKGEAPLDRSIELYQEGDRLKRHCEARLKDAQARIEQIAFGSDGKPAGLKPFDAD